MNWTPSDGRRHESVRTQHSSGATSLGGATSIADAVSPSHDAGEPVALQYFDYDEPNGPAGGHWNRIARQADAIAQAGYDAVWIQPPTQPVSADSNGYNPKNHFVWDSPLGTEAEFDAMVEALDTALGGPVDVYIDAVVNHMGTEDPETGVYPHLDSREYFHHEHAEGRTTGQLFDLWDLDQTHDHVSDYLYRFLALAAEKGVDGYRWDAAKHVPRWFFDQYLNEWAAAEDMFRVGEVFDGNVDFLQSYVDTGMNCFDYPLFFALKDGFRDDGDLRVIRDTIEGGHCLLGRDPYHASTFVSNHDEDPPAYERLAYAFVLTAPGYPTVYTNYRLDDGVAFDAPWLVDLLAVKRTLADGDLYFRHADPDVLVYERYGSLLAGINKHDQPRSEWVYTSWAETTLRDFAGTGEPIRTDADGWVELTVPPTHWVAYAPAVSPNPRITGPSSA